jgi:hypothetical protein
MKPLFGQIRSCGLDSSVLHIKRESICIGSELGLAVVVVVFCVVKGMMLISSFAFALLSANNKVGIQTLHYTRISAIRGLFGFLVPSSDCCEGPPFIIPSGLILQIRLWLVDLEAVLGKCTVGRVHY